MSPPNYASRTERLKPSPIREILSASSVKGVISFAGGLPASDTFPDVDELNVEKGDLQYGPSEGEGYLREYVAENLRKLNWDVQADQVLILTGSQQGIDLVGKLFVEEGTKVAVESPTYLAALQVFTHYGARYCPFNIEQINQGSDLEQAKLVYVNPTFQNPSSRVYTAEQRKQVAGICDNNRAVLFEDDPYRELYYEPCDRQPICSLLNKNSSWVYQSSFSKTLAPGLRIGFLVCSKDIYPKLLMLKQAADLHTSRVSQRLVYNMLKREKLDVRLDRLRQSYKLKRDVFNNLLHTHFGDIATWEQPLGGLFFWLALNEDYKINTTQLLSTALEAGVTFMPGEPFFADGRVTANCFRLNFSGANIDSYDEGLGKLAAMFKSHIHQLNTTAA